MQIEAGVSVSSIRGKLQVLQWYYHCLRTGSVDEAFDDCLKQEVDSKVRKCSLLSRAYDDSAFDGQIERKEIAKCVHMLKNNKTGGSDGHSW